MAEERSGVALGAFSSKRVRRLPRPAVDERQHEEHDVAHGVDPDAPASDGGAGTEADATPPVEAADVEPAAEDLFGDAVLRYSDRLARFAYTLCRDRDVAEESVTEVYARLWPKFERGHLHGVLPTLLRAVIAEVRDRTNQAPPASPTTRNRAIAVTPLDALGELPFEQRSAVVLHVVEGVDIEETALLLDEEPLVTAARVDSGLQRIAELVVTGGRDG